MIVCINDAPSQGRHSRTHLTMIIQNHIEVAAPGSYAEFINLLGGRTETLALWPVKPDAFSALASWTGASNPWIPSANIEIFDTCAMSQIGFGNFSKQNSLCPKDVKNVAQQIDKGNLLFAATFDTTTSGSLTLPPCYMSYLSTETPKLPVRLLFNASDAPPITYEVYVCANGSASIAGLNVSGQTTINPTKLTDAALIASELYTALKSGMTITCLTGTLPRSVMQDDIPIVIAQ